MIKVICYDEHLDVIDCNLTAMRGDIWWYLTWDINAPRRSNETYSSKTCRPGVRIVDRNVPE